MVMKVMNGIVNDKENLIKDISQAFKHRVYSDITFQLADGICISTNKFMLACRVPYFATMLFGSLAEKLPSQPIPLKDCDSNVFKEILKFVWEAEVSLSDMQVPLLLEFLETCRSFCLEELVDTIVDHLRILVNGNEVDFKDCLVALDFTEQHKFVRTSELFIEYIDKTYQAFPTLKSLGNCPNIR